MSGLGLNPRGNSFPSVIGAASWFEAGNLRTKCLILTIVGLNPLLKDKTLSIDARKPFRRWTKPSNLSELSRFVKDVATLSAAGELTEILRSVRKINQYIAVIDARILSK